MTLKHISIDQLKFHAIVFNCLERFDVHTISYLLSYSQDDLIKILKNIKKFVEQVLEVLQKHL